jgi:polar amino acid transport system permease protein
MVTLRISAINFLLTLTFGLVSALLRLSDSLLARALVRGYLELMAATYLVFEVWITVTALSLALERGEKYLRRSEA